MDKLSDYWIKESIHSTKIRQFVELDESREFRANIRHFGTSLEVSVARTRPDQLKRSMGVYIPPAFLIPKERTEEEQEERDLDNKRRSQRRAKQHCRWHVKALQADHMITLTVRDNEIDLNRFKGYFQSFSRLFKMRDDSFKYVLVPEKQERGAWHLHIAVKGRKDVTWLRRCWWMALGHKVEIDYASDGKKTLIPYVKEGRSWRVANPDEVRGNIDIKGANKRFSKPSDKWKTDKLANYLSKYLTKTFSDEDSKKGQRHYWPSKGIETPEPRKIWLKALDFAQAVREVNQMVGESFGCGNIFIWASPDNNRLWFGGSGIECPF